MLYLRQGRTALRFSSPENDLFRRYYVSCRHKEPKELSWQWSVKKTPEIMNCKNLCVSKICPKPSFFPRFKKVFVPTDKKACRKKNTPMSWKEYLSFLLPNPAARPPLIKCRKLQAERKKCCGNPMNCAEACSNLNCCSPPKEWYGQAEIFAVPSSLPPPLPRLQEPQPCAPPPPSEPTCILALKGICPQPRQPLNMDDYVYKKPFRGAHICEEIRELPSSFQCKSVCVPQHPGSDKNLRLSCGFFSEFKEVECPKAISLKNASYDLPPLICTEKGTKYHKKEINVEVKKGVCGRTTFLKPYKYAEKLPKKEKSCEFHTLTLKIKPPVGTQRRLFHVTSRSQLKGIKETEGNAQHIETLKADTKLEDMAMPSNLQRDSFSQPAKSGVGLHYMLLKPLSGRQREGLFTPPEPYRVNEDVYKNYNSQEIDPELIKLAEQTKQNLTYGIPTVKSEKNNTVNTLAKQLSKAAEEKMIKKAKEKGEERPIPSNRNSYQKSKLALLNKKKHPIVAPQATFMTEVLNVKLAKKKDTKPIKPRKDIICEGCLGIKAAEKEEKDPTPKSFIDCKVRPAGRCRGPQRKVYPDEGEPQNPYWKNKQRPYSLCNQQRPVIKKKERPYKMPCEENNPKREYHSFTSFIYPETTKNNQSNKKFHSTTSLFDAEINIPTLYDIIKVKGLSNSGKQAQTHSNDWDSHTSDSYGEKTYEEYDSLPDLSKFQPKDDDVTIKKMSYPVNLWENPDIKKKSNINPWSSSEGKMGSIGVQRIESLNQNVAYKKRTPLLQSITKESNSNAPSKYNVLFNPTSIKKQLENKDKSINSFSNKANTPKKTNNDKRITSSKTNSVHEFKIEKKDNTINSKELTTCSLTTQNMWGDSQYLSSSQSSQSMELIPQELKSWDKQKPHSLFQDNLINESSSHTMFRPKEDPNKSSKTENESQSMFSKEKISMLSDSGDLDNIDAIKRNKSD